MQNIPRSQWRSFCQRFSRRHRAWLTTMHYITDEGEVRCVSHVPLESVSLDRCTGNVVVLLTFLDGRTIRVRRPRALRIERTDAGAEMALEVDGGDGQLVRVAFRATARPEELDGLAPGEVKADEAALAEWRRAQLT